MLMVAMHKLGYLKVVKRNIKVQESDNKILELILASLTNLGNKMDDISTRLTAMETDAIRTNERHQKLEDLIEKNSNMNKREMDDIEVDLREICDRIKELESFQTGLQAKIAVFFSVSAAFITIIWFLLQNYIVPLFLG